MQLEPGALHRAQALLHGALAAGRSEEALKICEDFEMEVLFLSRLAYVRPCPRQPGTSPSAVVAGRIGIDLTADGSHALLLHLRDGAAL